MRALCMRSLDSSVSVDDKIVGKIDKGLLILVGFKYDDTEKEIDYIVNKIVNLRIFDDENGVMNKSILDVKGSILSVSQFTLYADTTKGHRPGYSDAMNSVDAKKLYNIFNEKLKEYVHVETGVFQAEMLVDIKNDGPITIMLERSVNNDKK